MNSFAWQRLLLWRAWLKEINCLLTYVLKSARSAGIYWKSFTLLIWCLFHHSVYTFDERMWNALWIWILKVIKNYLEQKSWSMAWYCFQLCLNYSQHRTVVRMGKYSNANQDSQFQVSGCSQQWKDYFSAQELLVRDKLSGIFLFISRSCFYWL